MNIKSVTPNPILSIDPQQRVDTNVKAQGSTDRDGNGRREQPEEEQKRHLNQQEFDEALAALRELPGLKANNLALKVEENEGVRTVLILAPDGKIVRRLSESQLWAATRDKDRQTGRILDRAM